jgi:hypothetical protein
MGLDSFFYKKELVKPEGFPDHNLCGGLLSGDGHSFRGKVYDTFIQEVSGETLYEDEGDHEYLETIAEALENATITEETYKAYNITQEEIDDLKKVFRYAADNNLSYFSWW